MNAQESQAQVACDNNAYSLVDDNPIFDDLFQDRSEKFSGKKWAGKFHLVRQQDDLQIFLHFLEDRTLARVRSSEPSYKGSAIFNF